MQVAIEIEGDLNGADLRIGIAVSRWNDLVTRKLLSGALDALAEMGVPSDGITVAWVPGAFELPLGARELALAGNAGVIALGCVIRGDTDHYTHVATECAHGLMSVALEESVPVAFGVLTADTLDQALERAGARHDNKGFEAAQTTVEQVRLLQSIRRT